LSEVRKSREPLPHPVEIDGGMHQNERSGIFDILRASGQSLETTRSCEARSPASALVPNDAERARRRPATRDRARRANPRSAPSRLPPTVTRRPKPLAVLRPRAALHSGVFVPTRKTFPD
jgi:hypothetical protein